MISHELNAAVTSLEEINPQERHERAKCRTRRKAHPLRENSIRFAASFPATVPVRASGVPIVGTKQDGMP
jgi:hypothetical protein